MSTVSIEYIRYNLKHSSPEAFIAGYRVAAQSLKAAPECLGFDLTQCCDEDPKSFILRITWASKEAHLQGFRQGPHFPAFFAAVRPFFDEIAEMKHYAGVDLEWTR